MIEWRNLDNNPKNIIVDKYIFNVNFSITKAYTDFKFCLPGLHIHLEGTVSQIFHLGPSLIGIFVLFSIYFELLY